MEQYRLILKHYSTALSPSRNFKAIFWLLDFCGVPMSVKFFTPCFPSAKDIKVIGDSEIMMVISKNQMCVVEAKLFYNS